MRATNQFLVVGPEVSFEWTIELPPDVTPPIVQITSGPPATTTATQATFVFSANEAGVTFQCAVDAEVPIDPLAWSSCTSPLVLNNVTPGDHNVVVRATDGAGNVGEPTAPWTWFVDGPADTTITSGPEADTHETSATFEFTANESGVTFECTLDDELAYAAVHVTADADRPGASTPTPCWCGRSTAPATSSPTRPNGSGTSSSPSRPKRRSPATRR